MTLDGASVSARWESAERGGARSASLCGAIDIGTNSCRLLVARAERPGAGREGGPGPSFRVVDAYSRVVALGEGLAAAGRLSEAAMGRALAALAVCAAKLRRRRVRRVRAVATEACRRAANAEAFSARVKRETGIAVEIISRAEEVQLALAGCLPLLASERRHALIFDIGGGSTQVSWLELASGRGEPAEPSRTILRAWHSIPFGVVGLSERYGGGAISPASFERMVAEVRAALEPFERAHGLAERARSGGMQMLGTSGTATTLAGVHQGLRRYRRDLVDGRELSRHTMIALARRIAGMSYQERAADPCIGHERARFVVGGCAILEAICGCWPVAFLRVADRGLREGILHRLMSEGDAPAIETAARPDGLS